MRELERWLEERIAETEDARDFAERVDVLCPVAVGLGGRIRAYREVLEWLRTNGESEKGGE